MSATFKLYSGILIQAMLIGGLLGLTEATWLLQTTGAPDKLSLLYGVLLYSGIGSIFGGSALLVCVLLTHFKPTLQPLHCIALRMLAHG